MQSCAEKLRLPHGHDPLKVRKVGKAPKAGAPAPGGTARRCGAFAAGAARISRLGYSPRTGRTCGGVAGRIGRTGSSGSRRASAGIVAMVLIIAALPSRTDYNGPFAARAPG